MKRSLIYGMLMLAFTLFVLTACGGGGKKNSEKTGATLTVAMAGDLPKNVLIGGIEITLILPPGVTVTAVPDDEYPDKLLLAEGGLTLSAAAADSIITATYTEENEDEQGRVKLVLANAEGIGVGSFATVTCNLNGTKPAADAFGLEEASLKIYGIDSTDDSTTDITAALSPTIAVNFK